MVSHNLVSLFVFFAILALVMTTYFVIREWIASRGRIRSRLTAENKERIKSEVELLRRNPSHARKSNYALPIVFLNKLILQSGMRFGLPGVIVVALACAATAYIIGRFTGFNVPLRILSAIACGIVLPLIVLRAMRDARQRRFEEQLPEAIDTLVRSLKAGHAISVAISRVCQHMPDPIGSEFRIAAAEMAYGLDLETAMVNLHLRVGQPDLALLSLAVGIQSKTGGNLAEVLSNMARVIRSRFKLRRKAHALASEARVSAYILSVLPIALFLIVSITTPSFYGQVWDHPYTKPVLAGAFAWMMLGNYVMRRMARIRI